MSDFYERNHRQYFESTVNIDPSAFLQPLTARLEPGATILDIGCGSGRDLRWLSDRGFRPAGFEKSPGLAGLARRHSGCPVIEGDFDGFDFSGLCFDALVLVGSLVHVARKRLPAALGSVCRALVPGGVVLVTFKEGNGTSRSADGRVFTLWCKEELEDLFTAQQFRVLEFFRSASRLHSGDVWLGFVLRPTGLP